MEIIEKIINSKKSEIKEIESEIERINLRFGLPIEKLINLQIALSEALVNAIVHGNKENPEKYVHVNISFDDKEITISVRDEGEGFDINKLPDPTDGENIYNEHGRGVFIIKSLVDRFECNSSNNGTEYKLTVIK